MDVGHPALPAVASSGSGDAPAGRRADVPPSVSPEPSAVHPEGRGRSRPRRRGIGTAARLAAFHALVIATVLSVVVFQLTRAFSQRYLTTVTNDLSETATAFAQGATGRPAGESLAGYTQRFLATHVEVGGDLLIVAIPAQGVQLGTPGSEQLSAAAPVTAALRRPPEKSTLLQVTVGQAPYEVVLSPIVDRGATVGTFVSAGSLSGYLSARARALELAIGEGVVTLLAAVASVYMLLRRLLGSVRRLTSTARDIGLRGQLDLRLGDRPAGDEVGEMAATFDAMVGKIDTAMSVQRQLLADVSHQLRTPLTVMRGHLEVMTRGRLDDPAEVRATTGVVLEELDHMRGLVERLLLLGRSLEVDFADLVPVDLRAMLGDISEASEVLATRRWELGPVPDIVIEADLDKVRGAVLNLIDNAVKATAPGDVIRVSAELSDRPGPASVDIMVDDSGPGIPPEERAAVLTRFGRPSGAPGQGTGLGLAIVDAVARAHGGQAAVSASPLGGCRVTMRLARAPSGHPPDQLVQRP